MKSVATANATTVNLNGTQSMFGCAELLICNSRITYVTSPIQSQGLRQEYLVRVCVCECLWYTFFLSSSYPKHLICLPSELRAPLGKKIICDKVMILLIGLINSYCISFLLSLQKIIVETHQIYFKKTMSNIQGVKS